MRAIDTNIIVRILTRDDHDQSLRARQVVDAGAIFVPASVILETAWVLCSQRYRLTPTEMVTNLRKFAGLPGVNFEHAEVVATALDWAEAGMDFADAMHLARSSACEAFVSFDRKLQNAAAEFSGVLVVEP